MYIRNSPEEDPINLKKAINKDKDKQVLSNVKRAAVSM